MSLAPEDLEKASGLAKECTAGMQSSPTRTASPSQDAAAWGLVFLPLATSLGYIVAALSGLDLGPVSLATLVAAVILIVVDKRNLASTGRLPLVAAPSTAWFLFPPGYFSRRARSLGTTQTQVWMSIICLIVAFAAQFTVLAVSVSKAVEAEPVLPACADRGSMQDVIGVFDGISSVRDAGIHGVILVDQTEVAQGPGTKPTARYCKGRMRASNDQAYNVDYDFEIQQGQVIVRLEVH